MSRDPLLLQAVLVVVAVAATATDLRTRRIPNLLTFSAMGAGLGLAAASGGVSGTLAALGGIGAAFGLLLLPYGLGAVKAGDVKLLMAFGALLGPWRTLWAFLFASVAGGLLSVAVLGVTRKGRQRVATFWIQLGNFISSRDPRVLKPADAATTMFIPYGLALAVGALIALFGEGALYS